MQKKIQSILIDIFETSELVSVTVPVSGLHGHYATNVAFAFGKTQQRKPAEVAKEFVEKILATAPEGFFKKVEATSQGFINFWLTPSAFHEELGIILEEGARYGSDDILKGKKVQIEFISANPTGPLTLANGRGGFFGDVFANVLEYFGAEVEREYYVNDTGNQIITLGKSVLAVAGKIPVEEKFYKGSYVAEWAAEHADVIVLHENNPLQLGQAVAKDLFDKIRTVIEKKANIRFDRWTSEYGDIHKKGFIEKIIKLLKAKGLLYDAEGATWLKTTQFGDDKDRVVVTSDKFPTYFLADAGHFLETKERGFDEKIFLFGPDHYGYVKRISAVAELVGIAKSEAIVTQAVRLVEEGKEVKMSKRKGEFIMLEELIDEVGTDATRFFFLQVSPEAHMDFDLGLAKERSSKNPVYYAQYAYVRARKILEHSENKDQGLESKHALSRLTGENELRLIRTLVRMPEVMHGSLEARRVHRITQYVVEVASAFHRFYEAERVVGEPKEIEDARILLVRGAAVILENTLTILGVSRPEEM
ncbi:MAG: arginine--tRNA ligase [Patescibacteria group bacterium]|nr:arginine--tRNA ligase [Patescibacteria group bacterium]